MKHIKKIIPFLVCIVFVMGIVSACGKDVDDKDMSSTDSSSIVSSDTDGSDLSDEKNNSGLGGDALISDSKNSADKNLSDDDSDNANSEQGGNNVVSSNNGNSNSSLNEILVQIFEMSSGVKVDKDLLGNSNNNGGGNNGGSVSGNQSGNGSSDSSSSESNGNIGSNGDNNSSANSGNSGNDSNSTVIDNEKAFVITVYPDQAPITCKNFEKLVNDGFYNGLQFYRVIKNFLAETGDPNNDGSGGSSNTIKGEFMQNGVDNRLSHTKGTVSMDRLPSDLNSADSKFFICYDDNCKFMDGQYAAFGKVTQGMEVIEDFLKIDREYGSDGSLSSPERPITIKRAESAGKDSDGNPRFKFYMEY
ncbi:MAG: peptidylprolyl isomerase [Ruminococcus sp.]|nr:peptidylprolyl isomerase [Ruminococcus sp.]